MAEIKTIEIPEKIYSLFEKLSQGLDIPFKKIVILALKEYLKDIFHDIEDITRISPILGESGLFKEIIDSFSKL